MNRAATPEASARELRRRISAAHLGVYLGVYLTAAEHEYRSLARLVGAQLGRQRHRERAQPLEKLVAAHNLLTCARYTEMHARGGRA